MEHSVGDEQGYFYFIRGENQVRVETDLSPDELGALFNLRVDGSYWQQFQQILNTESSRVSGLARDLSANSDFSIPYAYGLEEKEKVKQGLNKVFIVLSSFPDNERFYQQNFVTVQDHSNLMEMILSLKQEIQNVLDQFQWHMEIEPPRVAERISTSYAVRK